MWLKVWMKLPCCCVGATVVLLVLSGPAMAQQPVDQRLDKLEKQNEEFRKQVEILMKQNQDLQAKLNTLPAVPVTAPTPVPPAVTRDEVKELITQYYGPSQPAPAAAGAAKTGAGDGFYRIGSDSSVTAKFEDGYYFWIRTPNNDFNMHLGYWMQFDNVLWDQSSNLRTPPGARAGRAQGVASGAALGGIGDLEDGTYFRRVRPFVEGTLWENYEYRFNLALENIQQNTVGLDEFWAAVNNLPVIGTIRAGHVKGAVGLEADMTASSRTMTFMERSSYSEAIELNQNFTTGIWLHNSYLDNRVTYTFSAFRADTGAITGVAFGDGQWGWQGRLTALPLYDMEGRHFMHVGLSGGWRNGQSNDANSPLRTFQLRARPELRDDDPAAGGPAVSANANSNRLVDTGAIVAKDDFLTGLELLYVRGPLSVQAEYGLNFIDHATGFAPAGLVLNPALAGPTNYMFSGGYVQVAYTLTGENRVYDKKLGTVDRYYYGKSGPYTNAWFVRDENGNLNWGLGAWEIAARYSFVDLNDGTGLSRIQGGKMDGLSFALNWYLNNNLSWNFDYVLDHRYDLAPGVIPGWTGGFGTRIQLSF